jgi:hypothetical protein
VANEMLGKQNEQSFTESNVFAHHNFGGRALTIILNQNSNFAMAYPKSQLTAK